MSWGVASSGVELRETISNFASLEKGVLWLLCSIWLKYAMRWSPFSPLAPGYQSASLSASPPPAAPSLSEFPFLPNFVSFVLPGQDVGLFIHSRSRASRRFPSPPLGHDRAMRESFDLQRHSKGAFSHYATFLEVYMQWNAVWKFSVTR